MQPSASLSRMIPRSSLRKPLKALVGCAILGNDELTVGRVDEIELSQGFFDYTEKYTLKTSKIHMPARIDEITERRIQKVAKTIYRALGCSGFARWIF